MLLPVELGMLSVIGTKPVAVQKFTRWLFFLFNLAVWSYF